MTKRVLITGASGFVGGWLSEFLLRSGYQVSALVRNPAAAKHLAADTEAHSLELIRGDLKDDAALAQAVSKVDTVFHVAGSVRALTPRELFDVNEEGSRRVLAACAARQTSPNVVLVSSLAAAGPSKNDGWKAESDAAMPVSHYGKSKLAGERVARAFADKLRVSIVRPPIVFGGRDSAFAEMIRPIVSLGLHPYPGAFPFRRYSIIHVHDLCRAMWMISERGEALLSSDEDSARGKGIYFVADPKRFGYVELGNLIAQAMGARFMIPTPMPDAICWIGSAFNEMVGQMRGKPCLVNFDKVRESTAGSWTCSSEKIVRQMAWSPHKSAAERMQETVDWYFENGWFKPPDGYRKVHSFNRATPGRELEPSRRAS
jgi:nucleoside-diphosphate-sugar epimerase